MRRLVFVIPVVTIVIFAVSFKIFALNKPVSESIETMVENYMTENSSFESIKLNDEKQKLDDYTIQNSLNEIETQIKSNNERLEQLYTQIEDFSLKSSERASAQYQADHQTVYGYELEAQRELYTMQVSNNELYDEFSEKIVGIQEKSMKKSAYDLLLSIYANENRLKYLESLENQKQHELDIINGSLEMGYATESDVISAKAALEEVKTQKVICQNNIDLQIYNYNSNAKKKYEACLFRYTGRILDSEKKYSEDFKKESFYGEYYRKQANIYNEHVKALDEQLLKIEDGKLDKLPHSYEVSEENQAYYDRIYSYISDEREYYKNEAAIAENNAVRYEKSLDLYVKEVCLNISTYKAQRRALIADIAAAEKNLEISEGLLKEGRITKTALMEAHNEVLRLNCELDEIEAKIMVGFYILDNKIENI